MVVLDFNEAKDLAQSDANLFGTLQGVIRRDTAIKSYTVTRYCPYTTETYVYVATPKEDKIMAKTGHICLDFDDVINDYPGWEGEGFHTIRGKPVDGAKEGIQELREMGLQVLVASVRCGHPGGQIAIWDWLHSHGIVVDGLVSKKIPCDFYVDDKGIQFTSWAHLIPAIKSFKHWKDAL